MSGDYISNYEIRQNTRKEIKDAANSLKYVEKKLGIILNELEDTISILKEVWLFGHTNKLNEIYSSIEKGKDNIERISGEILEDLKGTKKENDLY